MKRIGKLTLLFAAIGCLFVSGVAFARATIFETKVKGLGWGNDNHKISGYLQTKETPEAFKCLTDRKIVVKNADKNERVGSGKTKGGGQFPGSFEIGLGGFAPKGTYRVVAKEAELGSVVCEKGSATIEQPYDEND